jgi:hypothetical protein
MPGIPVPTEGSLFGLSSRALRYFAGPPRETSSRAPPRPWVTRSAMATPRLRPLFA